MISNGSIPGSRSGTCGDVDVDPHLALGGHLRGRGGQPGGAEVLQRDEQAALAAARASTPAASSPRTGRRPGRSGACRPLSAPPSSAEASTEAPPMPSRPVEAPNSSSTLPAPAAALRTSALARRQPERHRVDQAVVLVGALEVHLAADRGHADRVAVVADARHRAVEQVARARARARPALRRARRSAASRAPRSGARRSRRCRAGSRPRRWRRPGRARPRWGGCATRP